MNAATATQKKDRWGIGWSLSSDCSEPIWLQAGPINWIHSLPGTFLADPFWCRQNNRNWILAEEYIDSCSKGRLVCLDPEQGMASAQVVLEKDYHLSYPFPIEDDGQLFLLPEAHQTRELRLWSCQEFPTGWRPNSLLLEDFPAIDPTVVEFEGNFYLWVGHQERDPRHQSFLFSSKSIHGPWKHHPKSPIRHHWTGRNGGAVIKHQDTLWRPCQNRRGTYGASLVLRQLLRLSPSEYDEGPLVDWVPESDWPYPDGLHHIHRLGNHWVFDAKKFVTAL